MVFIYALMSGQLVLYVGKTLTPRVRERKHRSPCNDCSSKDIPGFIEWEMKILEDCADCVSRERETHYYDTLKPLYNRNRPLPALSRYDYGKQYMKNHPEMYRAATAKYKLNKKNAASNHGEP